MDSRTDDLAGERPRHEIRISGMLRFSAVFSSLRSDVTLRAPPIDNTLIISDTD
jgi:hypothetical protein